MNSLWFLIAMMLTVPMMYAIWWIRHSCGDELHESIPSVSQPPVSRVSPLVSAGAQTRLMRWISIGEFMKVLTSHRDLIVIDLRAEACRNPFPVPDVFVLPVAPSELGWILECLPDDRSVAFCGASNLSIFMIETSPCMAGSAPFYILEGAFDLEEVA